MSQPGQHSQPPINPKGRGKGTLWKNSGDLLFGFGGSSQPGQPPAQWGQQNLGQARQGSMEPVWIDEHHDAVVPGYKLIVSDIPPDYDISRVSQPGQFAKF